MTTDAASVDALRTRLARAFEVAALRDPSAELAAFEAAVRREAWDEGYQRAKLDHCDYYPSADACTDDSPNPYGGQS